MPVVVVVIPVVLSGLSDDGSNTGTRCTTNDRALQAAAKDCAHYSAASRANQRSFTRPDPTLILIAIVIVVIVIVMVVPVVTAVVIAAVAAAAHAVIVGAVVVVLSICGREADCEQERNKDRVS